MLFISTLMVFSWAMPPPLSSIDRAPRTSSTSGLRPVREIGMKSPSERRLLLAVPFAGSTRAMYFSPRRLVWRTSTCTFSGRLDVLAHQELHPRAPADPFDVGDLPDHHVVGHDRRAGHHVEGVGEVGAHL